MIKPAADFSASIKEKNAQQLRMFYGSPTFVRQSEVDLVLSELIPPEWRIPADKLPTEDQTRVIQFTSECGILSDVELDIISKDAGVLLSQMATGKLECLTVTTAYCKAAAIAHQV